MRHLLRKKGGRARRGEMESSDYSAMGDISFLLLVFFIITASFLTRTGLEIDLPKETGVKTVPTRELLIVRPSGETGFVLSGVVEKGAPESPLDEAAFLAELESLKKDFAKKAEEWKKKREKAGDQGGAKTEAEEEGPPELVVLISMPEELPYGRFTTTLGLLKERGLRQISVRRESGPDSVAGANL